MTPITITFPFPDQHLTANGRYHWRVRAARTKQWRHATTTHAQAHGVTNLGPSNIQCHFTGVMTRDPANLADTVKACTDGLTDAGFWPDDNDRWVTNLPTTVTRSRKPIQDRTVTITITERES